jgi:hypothetical protein
MVHSVTDRESSCNEFTPSATTRWKPTTTGKGALRMSESTATYVGQVEQDPQGALWAVLYYRDQVLTREQVRSLRKAKRRVTDLVLSAADNYPMGPLPTQATGPTPSSGPRPCPELDLRLRSSGTDRAAIVHLV